MSQMSALASMLGGAAAPQMTAGAGPFPGNSPPGRIIQRQKTLAQQQAEEDALRQQDAANAARMAAQRGGVGTTPVTVPTPGGAGGPFSTNPIGELNRALTGS